jgi:hypothetical protein
VRIVDVPADIRTEYLSNSNVERQRADHSLPTSSCGGVGPEYSMLLWLISVDMPLFSEQES